MYVHKNFGWAKARRQAPPLPHGSYATACYYLIFSNFYVGKLQVLHFSK